MLLFLNLRAGPLMLTPRFVAAATNRNNFPYTGTHCRSLSKWHWFNGPSDVGDWCCWSWSNWGDVHCDHWDRALLASPPRRGLVRDAVGNMAEHLALQQLAKILAVNQQSYTKSEQKKQWNNKDAGGIGYRFHASRNPWISKPSDVEAFRWSSPSGSSRGEPL